MRVGDVCNHCGHVMTEATAYVTGTQYRCRRRELERCQRYRAGLSPDRVRKPRAARRRPAPADVSALSLFRSGAWRACLVDGLRVRFKPAAFWSSGSAFAAAAEWAASVRRERA